MKKFGAVLVAALVLSGSSLGPAQAAGPFTVSLAVPGTATYDGSGRCVQLLMTLTASGGNNSDFGTWETRNERLVGPTSRTDAPAFFYNELDGSGEQTLLLCPGRDRPGIYTYQAEVEYYDAEGDGNKEPAGTVTARFNLKGATTRLVKVGTRAWQVKIVGQPHLVARPSVVLQRFQNARWKPLKTFVGNRSGVVALTKGPKAKYRLVYRGTQVNGINGSISPTFRTR